MMNAKKFEMADSEAQQNKPNDFKKIDKKLIILSFKKLSVKNYLFIFVNMHTEKTGKRSYILIQF